MPAAATDADQDTGDAADRPASHTTPTTRYQWHSNGTKSPTCSMPGAGADADRSEEGTDTSYTSRFHTGGEWVSGPTATVEAYPK